MLAFVSAAALLGVTAWLILIAGLVYGAVVAGVPWVVAAIVAIALHAVGVFLLVRAIRAMVENLTFAATRRTLSESSTAPMTAALDVLRTDIEAAETSGSIGRSACR